MRNSKWSKEEAAVLVEAASGTNVLSEKFSPGLTSAQGSSFWTTTTEKINAVGGNNRSKLQVEKKWRDLKSLTKKKEVRRRRTAQKTGGGPELPSLTPLEEKILSTIPVSRLDGIDGGVDTFSFSVKSPELRTVVHSITEDRTDNERMFHTAIEATIASFGSGSSKNPVVCAQTADSCTASETTDMAEIPLPGNDGQTSPVASTSTGKPQRQERRNKPQPKTGKARGIDGFIAETETKKLEEIRKLVQIASSIDVSLKELVRLKKIELNREVDLDINSIFGV